ncbi:serum response factor-binding protein 1 [Pteronotus mesoamericanus]|uniref:serum response factor-binding protein 1 n=1 Tax=Pteronotus mesoamericanus TaxID=1884717 RepID=UPI0023EA8B79|nr:serum response factor-binding protein 1 [Pteronotus parnellii mesoamericanus]
MKVKEMFNKDVKDTDFHKEESQDADYSQPWSPEAAVGSAWATLGKKFSSLLSQIPRLYEQLREPPADHPPAPDLHRNAQFRRVAFCSGSCCPTLPYFPPESLFLLYVHWLPLPSDEFWAEEAAVEGALRRRCRTGDTVHVPAAAGPLPASAMAESGTLNLNNEVVKMRKEVKRIRVLVIRKLVRSVGRLKSKKGTEDALLKNQRRAQRLLEEIHAMKELKPDIVTKSALGDDINFEKICKKPDSTAAERATARLATHPLLKKKIDVLKAAVKAFKDARQNDAGVQSSKNASEENYSKDASGSNDDAIKLQHEGAINSEQKDKEAKMLAKKPVNSSKVKIAKMEHGPQTGDIPNSPSEPSEKDSLAPSEPQKVPKMTPLRQNKQKKASNSSLGENSDGEELLEEEKEYFDDSTEERFYNQSSVSEDSDSGDDFFIGKVRRTRKKDSNCHSSALAQKSPQKMSPEENILETCQGIRNDKSKPSTEARKFESVFFHSLSGSKNSRRSYREQAPKSNTPGFQQNEPQLKNQFIKHAQRGPKNTEQQTQLPLHPSWEASRRRKEQQSKIAVFQGKKITFDD